MELKVIFLLFLIGSSHGKSRGTSLNVSSFRVESSTDHIEPAENGPKTQQVLHINTTTDAGLDGIGLVSEGKTVTETDNAVLVAGYVITPCMLLCGLFGNTMTMMIMHYEEFRVMPSSLILRALAVSDTSVILMWSFNKQFMIDLLGLDVRALSTASCKIFFWFWKTSKMTSSWFIVLISMERFIAVVFALHAHSLNTKGNVLTGIMMVYGVIGGYNLAWDILNDGVRNGRCFPNIPNPGYEHVSRPMIVTGATMYAFVPGGIILVLNTFTVARLIKMTRKRHQMTARNAQRKDEKVTAMMTGMLLGVSFAFLVLVVPVASSHIVSLYTGNDLYTSNDPLFVALREITQATEMLNYSINFLLYVLCCRKFRQCFVKIFLGNCWVLHNKKLRSSHRDQSSTGPGESQATVAMSMEKFEK